MDIVLFPNVFSALSSSEVRLGTEMSLIRGTLEMYMSAHVPGHSYDAY